MPRFIGNKSFINHDKKIGVLLTNLGTPEQATTSALRRYLREFLSDPRVVEIPRVIWLTILYCFILPFRPAKSAKLYESIWTDEGSPLLVNAIKQKEKIAEKIKKHYHNNDEVDGSQLIEVKLAMRYGQPSITSALTEFQKQGVEELIVLPLYPQYAGATTGSTFDAVVNTLKKWRWVPSLTFIASYHDDVQYIKALTKSIEEHISEHGKPDKLVLSYHGMPELFYQWGDPYFEFCQKTTEKVIAKLGFSDEDYVMTFQSRFGKAEWLKPYTDATLEELAKNGDKHVAIISPAFSADCLETLEELVHENKEVFIEAGGEQYHYISALNDRDDHIQALTDLLLERLPKRN